MKNIYQVYKKSISFCWKSVVSTSHAFFILRLVLCLFGAVLPILGTKLSALLIDTITYTVAYKADFINGIKPFLVLLIGILLINVFNRAVDTLILFFTTLHKDLMQNSLKKTISRRASEIDLSYFDCAEFYDQLQDINANTPYIADTIFEIIDLFRYAIQFIILLSIMAKASIVLTLLLIISVIPSVVTQNSQLSAMYDFDIAHYGMQRKMHYISNLFVSRDFAKDIRCYNVCEWLIEKYQGLFKEFIRNKAKKSWKFSIKSIVFSLLPEIATILFFGYLIYKIYLGANTVGDFIYYQGIASQITACMITVIYYLGRIKDGNARIINFLNFMDTKSRLREMGNLEVPNRAFEIEFQNVHFRYDENREEILKGVSFIIHAGEKVALVGKNGEGKSTIIKLLLRLYEPTQGRILIDGIDIRKYNLKMLRRSFSVMMQDFCNYAFTLRECVALSDCSSVNNTDRIIKALEEVGAADFVNKFKNGIETYMTRIYEEEGEELSGGQWQKVALSRAFFQNGSVYIFDEPSASLDPEAEARLFSDFRSIVKEKGMLLISHRLADVKGMDKILVLSGGVILEEGSHVQLMKKEGVYKKLFMLQAERYSYSESGNN